MFLPELQQVGTLLEVTVNEEKDSPAMEDNIDVVGTEDSPEEITGNTFKKPAGSPLDANQQLEFTRYGDYDDIITSNFSTLTTTLVNYPSSPNPSPANRSTLTLKLKRPTDKLFIMSQFSKMEIWV